MPRGRLQERSAVFSSSSSSLSSCWVPGFSEHRTPLFHWFALCHRECHTNRCVPGATSDPCPPLLAARSMPADTASPTSFSPSPQHKELPTAPHPLTREGDHRRCPGAMAGSLRRSALGSCQMSLGQHGLCPRPVQGAHDGHANLLARLPPRGLDPSLRSWEGLGAGGLRVSPISAPNAL